MFKQYLVDWAITLRNRLEVSQPLYRLRAGPLSTLPETITRFAIIPGDMGNPSGSMGDMAMFAGLLQSLRKRNLKATFTIVGMQNHKITVPGIGEVPVVAAWSGKPGTIAFDGLIRQHQALYVMGADILDGKYGAARVQRIVEYCNHSVQFGIPATILGFSFNRNPRRMAVHALSKLHPKVRINVRDQASLDRFKRIVGIPAGLCADSAFLMPPALDPSPEAETWITAMRAAGRGPVGVNLNAHALGPAIEQIGTDALIDHIADQLKLAGKANQLAFMLIPHDLKPHSADVAMLQALEEKLLQKGFPHVLNISFSRPDTIKRIVGLLDLVITGRMHLAIAALGSGTPILAITYQDKFEGLYQHFGLPLEHTLSPLQCLGNEFLTRVNNAYTQRHDMKERIRASLPQVIELASRNLILTNDRRDLSKQAPHH